MPQRSPGGWPRTVHPVMRSEAVAPLFGAVVPGGGLVGVSIAWHLDCCLGRRAAVGVLERSPA